MTIGKNSSGAIGGSRFPCMEDYPKQVFSVARKARQGRRARAAAPRFAE
jgi:hypothetical protein